MLVMRKIWISMVPKLIGLKSVMAKILRTLKPRKEPICKLKVYRSNHSYQQTFSKIPTECRVYNINELSSDELDFIAYEDTKLIGIKQNSDVLLDNNCAFEFTISQTDSTHPLIKELSLVVENIRSYSKTKRNN